MLYQVVVAACEKYPGKFDVAAKMIKEASLVRLYVMLDECSAHREHQLLSVDITSLTRTRAGHGQEVCAELALRHGRLARL